MRSVTQGTIIRYRGMLPQVRALFFGVTGIAGFIDRQLLQQKIVVAIVWVMTIAARHIAKP